MELGLRGRSAMVAAASKGIGRAVAESLLAEGCRVSIASRSRQNLESARAEMERAAPGAEIASFPCDVTNPEDLQRWFEGTRQAFGGLDILVTNTGGPPAALFLDLTEEQWRTGIEGTLMNVVRLCRLVIPELRKRKWGRIVHLTSFVAKQPMDVLTVSSTLRAGLSALTKTLANQLAADNILVNAVLPGNVMTARQLELSEVRSRQEGVSVEEYTARAVAAIPLRRHAQPREIGDVVAFLCSERASYITGATLQVDGGIIQSTF